MRRDATTAAGKIDPATADWLAAVGHPYRVEILRHFLTAGTATPREIADAQGLRLGTASYHVRFLNRNRIVRLAGRTQHRGAVAHHYQLIDRERAASILWGLRAALLVTDIERDHGRSNATVTLDADALAQMENITADYLARLGELGLQTRERQGGDTADLHARPNDALTKVAILLAEDPAPRGAAR